MIIYTVDINNNIENLSEFCNYWTKITDSIIDQVNIHNKLQELYNKISVITVENEAKDILKFLTDSTIKDILVRPPLFFTEDTKLAKRIYLKISKKH